MSAALDGLEKLLEAERAQLPPWFVVGLGSGIAAWFALDARIQWAAFLCLAAALAVAGFVLGKDRAGRALGWFALSATLGCALVWVRANWVAQARLEAPEVVTFDSRVERVEPLVARGVVRLTLRPADPSLPPRVRVTIPEEDAPPDIGDGASVRMRARLTPPPPMALPRTHDFARDAWFQRIGAVGKNLGPVQLIEPGGSQSLDHIRARLGQHIRERLPGPAGGIAPRSRQAISTPSTRTMPTPCAVPASSI